MVLEVVSDLEDDWRHEVKLVCHARESAKIDTLLRAHPAAPRPIFHGRRVQSLYFDTPDDRALHENLAGASDRWKLRLRWYGDETVEVRAGLELKIRRAALGTKKRFDLDQPLRIEDRDRLEFMDELSTALPSWWSERLSGLGPAQWISYRREYWRTLDDRLRITVDRELCASDQRFRSHLCNSFKTPLPDMIVVEIKAAQRHEREIREFQQSFPLVRDRCSKFVLATSPSDAPILSHLEP